MVFCLIAIVLGYLLGSILPAYYIGKLKGIDIREEGAQYAGTINVYHVVGATSALATLAIDFSKGVIAIYLALGIGANYHCAQMAGIAAIAGHVLPFYLDFRGGQGVACATGILLYYLARYFSLAAIDFSAIFYLALIVAIFAYVAKHGEIISVIILPVLAFTVLLSDASDSSIPYFVFINLYIMSVGIYNIKTRKLLIIEDETFHKHWWRVVLRPVLVLLIPYYWHYSKSATLILIGSVAGLFLLIDGLRLSTGTAKKFFASKVNFLFRQSEKERISSINLLFIAMFLVVLFFNRDIAMVSLAFLIFGDIFSKVFGLAYARHRLFHKSVEGSLAYLGCALVCVYVFASTTSLALPMLLIGAIAATIAEALPLNIDDNLSVALLSGTAMFGAQLVGIG